MPELADLLQLQRRSDLPAIRPGDTVRVHVRVVEGNRERPQMFEGVVLEVKKPNNYDGSFRVRRVTHGVGVERTFMFQSPRVEKVEVARRGYRFLMPVQAETAEAAHVTRLIVLPFMMLRPDADT